MDKTNISGAAEIERRCFSEPWSERAIEEALESETAHFFAALCGGKTVGYIGAYCAADECYVNNLGVLPEYRNRGIGSKLVEQAVKTAKELGMSFISLEVRPSNKSAVGLYEKYGFERVGLRRGFYSSPKEDGLIMTRYFKG